MNEEVKIYEDAAWGKYGKDIIPSRIYHQYLLKHLDIVI